MLLLPARKLCLKITAVKIAKLFAKSSAPRVLFATQPARWLSG
nr:hypothetical protein [uncultured Campylobacter sp.]